ncbi:conserved hypothetical protein, partial [Ricinus communis]
PRRRQRQRAGLTTDAQIGLYLQRTQLRHEPEAVDAERIQPLQGPRLWRRRENLQFQRLVRVEQPRHFGEAQAFEVAIQIGRIDAVVAARQRVGRDVAGVVIGQRRHDRARLLRPRQHQHHVDVAAPVRREFEFAAEQPFELALARLALRNVERGADALRQLLWIMEQRGGDDIAALLLPGGRECLQLARVAFFLRRNDQRVARAGLGHETRDIGRFIFGCQSELIQTDRRHAAEFGAI